MNMSRLKPFGPDYTEWPPCLSSDLSTLLSLGYLYSSTASSLSCFMHQQQSSKLKMMTAIHHAHHTERDPQQQPAPINLYQRYYDQ